jgi:2-C-methyl-D-erythritol 4-phosphate cytidylyltransferase
VAAPAEEVEAVRALLVDQQIDAEVEVVAGGATRQASVARAVASLAEDIDVVLVHDAARPLVPVELVDAVAAAIRAGADAVIPVLPVADTIKRVAAGVVESTLDRASLRAVQTPQGFRRAVLANAHAAGDGGAATDDAGLVEAIGVPVSVVEGSAEAFKVTRPIDLMLAEAVLAHRRAAGVR